jgi:hypothetical protein
MIVRGVIVEVHLLVPRAVIATVMLEMDTVEVVAMEALTVEVAATVEVVASERAEWAP